VFFSFSWCCGSLASIFHVPSQRVCPSCHLGGMSSALYRGLSCRRFNISVFPSGMIAASSYAPVTVVDLFCDSLKFPPSQEVFFFGCFFDRAPPFLVSGCDSLGAAASLVVVICGPQQWSDGICQNRLHASVFSLQDGAPSLLSCSDFHPPARNCFPPFHRGYLCNSLRVSIALHKFLMALSASRCRGGPASPISSLREISRHTIPFPAPPAFKTAYPTFSTQ